MKNKKILLAAALLAVVGFVGYQATTALFTDTERTEDSTFTAGTLDMNVDGNNGTAFDNIVVGNIGADGTVSGSKTWTINNTGTVPGELAFQMLELRNYENRCNEPEALVDTTCGDPQDVNDLGLGLGELGNAVSTVVKVGDTQYVASNLATANQGEYKTQWDAAPTVTIPAGGSVTVTMDWATNPASYGNEVQSDSLDFDLQFDLTQVTPS